MTIGFQIGIVYGVAHDVVTIGRISADIYPYDIGVNLEDVTSFGKYLGGSPSNVAVAAAQHGHRVALISKTGRDPFGTFLHRELQKFEVNDAYVTTDNYWPTPVTFCAIKPPDDFPLYFYRTPTAPDLQLSIEDIPQQEVAQASILWFTLTGLCQEPSKEAHLAALQAREEAGLKESERPDGHGHTIIDLDYRPMFWPSSEEAQEAVNQVLAYVTVAIGNEAECAVAVGPGTPDEQADRLLAAGVKIAVVKLGPEGVLAKTATERVVSAPVPVDTVNGLGAGDAFGGAFCHGLLSGWPLAQVLDFANAAGAIVASQISCADAMPTPGQVIGLLQERNRWPYSSPSADSGQPAQQEESA